MNHLSFFGCGVQRQRFRGQKYCLHESCEQGFKTGLRDPRVQQEGINKWLPHKNIFPAKVMSIQNIFCQGDAE